MPGTRYANCILLCLTFLREQELVAWTHSDTAGSYKSIASVTETSAVGNVDAVYTVVQRTINGNVVQYIERMVELYFPIGATDAWQVDAGLQYNGELNRRRERREIPVEAAEDPRVTV